MDGEQSVNLWYRNAALRQHIVDNAKRLTHDDEMRADLIQEAWAAICEGIDADASEESLFDVARKAQERCYREQVPRQKVVRGSKVLTVRLDDEHQLWLNKLKGRLEWPMSAVLRLVIEKGAAVLLEEVST